MPPTLKKDIDQVWVIPKNWDDLFRDDAAGENKGFWESYLTDLERYGIISKE